jgi:hypothetical protein
MSGVKGETHSSSLGMTWTIGDARPSDRAGEHRPGSLTSAFSLAWAAESAHPSQPPIGSALWRALG